jgi:hypothetical protein
MQLGFKQTSRRWTAYHGAEELNGSLSPPLPCKLHKTLDGPSSKVQTYCEEIQALTSDLGYTT